MSISDCRARARIFECIRRAKAGNLGDHHSLEHGLHEMRIHYGKGYRLYYTWDGKAIVVLFLAGDKNTQAADIRKARAYLEDYRRRP